MQNHVESSSRIFREGSSYADAAIPEEDATREVPLGTNPEIVGLAIHLDRKTCRRAVEIQDVRPFGMLAMKLQPARPTLQRNPEAGFGWRELSP